MPFDASPFSIPIQVPGGTGSSCAIVSGEAIDRDRSRKLAIVDAPAVLDRCRSMVESARGDPARSGGTPDGKSVAVRGLGCANARGPLHNWYAEAIKATWRRPQDIKDQYPSASICGNNRVVFNVGGNKYRLVVEVQYDDLKKVFRRLEKIFQAEEGTAQVDERDVLVTLVAYFGDRDRSFRLIVTGGFGSS